MKTFFCRNRKKLLHMETACPTVLVVSGFSRLCLKIPNPDQYTIGIGKIPILASVLFSKWILIIIINEHVIEYTLLKRISRNRNRNRTKYKIKSSTCTRRHANKNKNKNNPFSEHCPLNCPLRALEIAFQRVKISKFSGGEWPQTPQSG